MERKQYDRGEIAFQTAMQTALRGTGAMLRRFVENMDTGERAKFDKLLAAGFPGISLQYTREATHLELYIQADKGSRRTVLLRASLPTRRRPPRR